MTKEELRTYRSIKLERDKLKQLVKNLEAVMYKPRVQRLDGMPRSGAFAGSSVVENIAIKHADLLETYQQKEAELLDAMQKIEKAIDVLDSTERTLIRLYYIEGVTWEEVAVQLGYSWRHVHRIHGFALEKLKATE